MEDFHPLRNSWKFLNSLSTMASAVVRVTISGGWQNTGVGQNWRDTSTTNSTSVSSYSAAMRSGRLMSRNPILATRQRSNANALRPVCHAYGVLPPSRRPKRSFITATPNRQIWIVNRPSLLSRLKAVKARIPIGGIGRGRGTSTAPVAKRTVLMHCCFCCSPRPAPLAANCCCNRHCQMAQQRALTAVGR